MLKIISPLSFIFSTINMCIYPVTICFIFPPFTFKNVTIYMEKFSVSASLVIFPLPFIFSSIRPFLNSKTVSYISYPLPFINCTTFKFIWGSFFSFHIRVIDFFTLVRIVEIPLISRSTRLFIQFRLLAISFNHSFPTFVTSPTSLNFNSCFIFP